MKAIVRFGIWKAIAFLTAVFSLFMFIGCCKEEPVIVPTVKTVEIIVRPSTLHDPNGKLLIVVGKIVSEGGGVIREKGLCISSG